MHNPVFQIILFITIVVQILTRD